MEGELFACVDCGAGYEFSEQEQREFTSRGFAPPKRCRACRAAKRRRAAEQRRGAPRAAGPRPAPLERPTAARHPTTCSLCQAATEVPFRPDGVRPVYCLDCLKKQTR